MRKIKFNFWDKRNNKMIYWNEIISKNLYKYFYEERYIPLQYTGLKDKNGKEIYEGDIVEYSRYNNCLFEIYYSNDAAQWSLYWIENKNMYEFNKAVAMRLKVVGNKYENLELMENA